MSIDAGKALKLKAFLEMLPEHMARQLLTAVELDRVAGGKDLPHDVLLEGLRPHAMSADDQIRRTPTPMRLFCDPFEDLLVPEHKDGKQRGLVARTTLVPLWDWLAGDVMPALHREQCEKLTMAILEADAEKIQSVATELQTSGGAAIVRALEGAEPGTARRAELTEKLGSEEAVEDAVDIARVLQMAGVVTKVRRVMHRPVPRVSSDLATFLKKGIDAIPEEAADSVPYLMMIASRRLERPWEILRARAAMTNRTEDLHAFDPRFAIVVDWLFAELDKSSRKFAAMDPQTFDPHEALDALTMTARLLRGLTDEMESISDQDLHERLEAVRSGIAETLQLMFERAPRQIRQAMPFQQAGAYAARSSKRPDLAKKPVESTMERARKLGTFMRDSRPASGAVGVGMEHAESYDEILDGLNAYREGLLSEMRNIDSAETIHNARAYLDLSVELTAILVSEGEAHILRRKAVEAERGDNTGFAFGS